MSTSLFPYDKIRGTQDVLVDAIYDAVRNNKHLIAHAPTGLGKTAASIAATLSNAIRTDKTIFFLTPMHTQHKIAIETIREIKKKHDVKLVAVDIIGKKHMCLQSGVHALGTKDFAEYCKVLREDNKCNFFNNLKQGEQLSFNAKAAISELKETGPAMTEEMIDISEKYEVCPYEVGIIMGKEAKVIITDYYYMFHPKIRDSFLTKIGKELSDAVIIVDEAHNLPNRIKDLASEKISNIILKRAIFEAEKFKRDDLIKYLNALMKILESYSEKSEQNEVYFRKETFVDDVNDIMSYEALADAFEDAAVDIREEQKTSYIGSVAMFLYAWLGTDEGFTRIFSRMPGHNEELLFLSYKCLDPGIISAPVISESASTIIMSGTLTPTHMYGEILGFDRANTKELTLKSPFPEENRLNIIVPQTSTKYESRSEEQYKHIAEIVSKSVNVIPGNSAVFFPSYKLRDDVYKFMNDCEKTVFVEKQGLSKQEKEEMLENFKGYKNTGAVLLGVTSGSFGEGIDLPGDFLKGVIVVGLPLRKPDLESNALIKYYDQKFRRGWEYGYIFPAFNRTLQSAGRCIRSETDRGVIIFLDERYAWPRYKECFPESWNMKITVLYESLIRDFFGIKQPEKKKTLGDF